MRIRGRGASAITAAIAAATLALALPAAAGAGHMLLDHPAPSLGTVGPPPVGVQSGGAGAEWDLIETIATGNPHTDLDFFPQGGDVYASVGMLAMGPNAGGQTIVQLTDGGTVAPRLVSSHPSAGCLSDPSVATALQHDSRDRVRRCERVRAR